MFKIKYFLLLLFLCTFLKADNSVFFFENKIKDFEYFEDKNNQTILEVINKKQWQKTKDKINFGYTQNPYWIKFEIVVNDSNSILTLNDYEYSYIDIYITKDNKVIKSYKSGVRQAVDKELLPFRKTSLTLDLDTNVKHEIYIRASSKIHPLNLPIQILKKEPFNKLVAYDTSIMIFYFFILILMFIYNIFLYIITRIKYYILYLTYLFTLVLTTFYTSGYAKIYLFNESGLNNLQVFFFKIAGLIMFCSLMILISSFLKLNKLSHKIIKYSYITLITISILNWILIFTTGKTTLIIINFLNLLSLAIIVLISLFIFRRIFKFDMLSIIISCIWLPLSLGIGMFISNKIFMYTSPLVVEYIMKVLFIYETIFISLLLAYHMKFVEREKNKTEIELLKKEKLLIRANKLTSMGEMLNSIAHQWKQPLSRINSIVFKSYNLLEENKSDKLKKELLKIENETSYMSNTISSLLSFFHINKRFEAIDLFALAYKQKEFINQLNSNIEVVLNTQGKEFITYGYKNEYIQVINVLIENAIDSINESKVSNPKIILEISKKDDKIAFSIQNTGKEINKEIIEKIFEPYFTTKNKDSHHGIGLYMSKILIEESMGKALIVQNVQNGVKFTIKG